MLLGELGQEPEGVHVSRDHVADAGPKNLEDHCIAVGERRSMGLGHRGGRERLGIDGLEEIVEATRVGRAEQSLDVLEGDSGTVRLELGELVRPLVGDDVPSGRQDLAELDERRSQVLHHPPEAGGDGKFEDLRLGLEVLVSAQDLADHISESDVPKKAHEPVACEHAQDLVPPLDVSKVIA